MGKKKAEFAELKAIREKERQEALEMAALQARRAEEAEKRRAEAKAAPRGPPPAMERTGSSGAVRPPLPLAGAKLGWREKEKLRAEGKEVPTTRTESPMARAATTGPPRIALAGGKPSWRDREAAKANSGESAGPPPSARAPSSSGGAPLSRGRSGRGDEGRDGSPAPAAAPSGDGLKPSGAPGRFVPPHLRNKN